MPENADIQIFPNPDAVAVAGADIFARIAIESIEAQGAFKVALSGGSTPKLLHQALANPPHQEQLPWNKMYFYWGDERDVPPYHPESNFRMAQETLFDHVSVSEGHVLRIQAEKGARNAAAAYEKTLQRTFGIAHDEKKAGIRPPFDLVLLGIGTDGHTASLFPGTSALEENERWVSANHVPVLQTHRITLTLPVLNAAKQIVFLVTGTAKAEILSQIFGSAHDEPLLPAQRVKARDGKVTWLIDADAAALMEN